MQGLSGLARMVASLVHRSLFFCAVVLFLFMMRGKGAVEGNSIGGLIQGIEPTLLSFYQSARRVKTLVRGTFLVRFSTLLPAAISTIVLQRNSQSPGNTLLVLRLCVFSSH